MNQQPKSTNRNTAQTSSPETASWNRQRTSAELASFVLDKLAALESISLED